MRNNKLNEVVRDELIDEVLAEIKVNRKEYVTNIILMVSDRIINLIVVDLNKESTFKDEVKEIIISVMQEESVKEKMKKGIINNIINNQVETAYQRMVDRLTYNDYDE